MATEGSSSGSSYLRVGSVFGNTKELRSAVARAYLATGHGYRASGKGGGRQKKYSCSGAAEPPRRARVFPPEQFACSKSAWVTRHSPRTDFVGRISDVQGEDTTGGTTGTCDGSASVSVVRRPRSTSTSSVAQPLSQMPCTHDRLPDTPAQQPNEVHSCCQTQSLHAGPMSQTSCLCGHGARPSEVKGRRELRVTGVKWFNVEGRRSCCEPLGLPSFRHQDGVPFQRKRRSYRGDPCISSD